DDDGKAAAHHFGKGRPGENAAHDDRRGHHRLHRLGAAHGRHHDGDEHAVKGHPQRAANGGGEHRARNGAHHGAPGPAQDGQGGQTVHVGGGEGSGAAHGHRKYLV